MQYLYNGSLRNICIDQADVMQVGEYYLCSDHRVLKIPSAFELNLKLQGFFMLIC